MDPTTTPQPQQRLLPLDAVEQSDAAYLSAVDDCHMPPALAAVARWMILTGDRDPTAHTKARPPATLRQLAERLHLAPSTIHTALTRLTASGLLARHSTRWHIRLGPLVALAEAIREQLQDRDADPPAVEEAIAAVCARQRSPALGCARLNSGSVEEKETYPVSLPYSVSGEQPITTERDRAQPSATERDRAQPSAAPAHAYDPSRNDGRLLDSPAWRSLQTDDLRPAANRPALLRCFTEAVAAGLLDDTPDDVVRFMATAYDLAHDAKVGKPAVCLRVRTERRACFRISPEGSAWARRVTFHTENATP